MKMTGHPLMLRLGSSLNLLSVIMVLVCYSTTCILAMRSGSNSNTDEPYVGLFCCMVYGMIVHVALFTIVQFETCDISVHTYFAVF